MFESVDLSFMSDLKKESLFTTFHNLCNENEGNEKKMEKCGIEVNKSTNFLYNQLMDAMLNSMLKYRNRSLIPISTRPQNVELEKSEKETRRCIAGFIAFSLKKSLKKYDPLSTEISILLDSWGSKSDNDFGSSLEEYTNAWVDLVNRGGFHHVSDEFYLFIKAVEMEARTILNQELFINYCGEDLKMVLYNTFLKSENIEVCWHKITRNISNLSLKEIIKKKILLKWINIRANAFVKLWIQMIKRESSMTIRGTILKKISWCDKGCLDKKDLVAVYI